LTNQDLQLTKMPFADHHYFTKREIEKIIRIYEEMPAPKVIVTTEKDAVRLLLFQEILKLKKLEIWALPIEMTFIKENEVFDKIIRESIKKFISEH